MAGRFITRCAGALSLLLWVPAGAFAQPIDCARLPAAERDAARRAQTCVDPVPAAAATRVDPAARVTPLDPAVRAAQLGLLVPRLVDAPLNRNDERIGRFRLETLYRSSGQPRDWVLAQQPDAGARLRAGGTLTLTLSDGSRVLVPNVVGGDTDSARRQLTSATLGARSESVSGVPAGRVVSQQPPAGTEVTRRSVVVLRVTDGTRPAPPPDKKGGEIAVPNVVGLAYDDAITRLRAFRPERSHRASLEPGGRVIAQDPPANTLQPPGATVSIVLSDGTLTVVPDLIGLQIAKATQSLAQAALRAQRIDSSSERTPAGEVIGQAPVAGDTVARGTAVRVQVSTGPPLLEVPDVIGLRIDEAQSRLAGFAVTRSEAAANAPRGEVVAQRPAAGARLPRGGAVTIAISSGQEAIEVPNVIGADVDAARSRLGEFRVSTINVPGRPPRAQVVAQAPGAGTMHPPGGPVTLSLSDGSVIDATPPPPPPDETTPTLRWWLLAGAGGALLFGAGTLLGRVGAPRAVPRVTASATLALAPEDVRIEGAAPISPALEFRAALEAGEPTVEPPEPEAE